MGLKHGRRSPDYAAIIYFPQKCLFIVRQQVRLLLIHSGRSCHLSLLTLLQLLSSRTICQPFSILHCYHSSLPAILLTARLLAVTHTPHITGYEKYTLQKSNMRVLFIGAAWPAIMPIVLCFSYCPSMLISSQTQMGKNSNMT